VQGVVVRGVVVRGVEHGVEGGEERGVVGVVHGAE